MIACRKSFTDTLLELARQDKDIVAVTTDARGSVTLGDFAKELPAQFVECGIAEQDAVGISAGLAHSGKKVFVCGPACFYVARSLEQVKVDLAYSQNNVKILGVSGGVAYGALGATHHSLHDIAVLRTFPGMNIVLPCDARQTRKLVKLLVDYPEPVYVRVGRAAVPDVYENDDFDFVQWPVKEKDGSVYGGSAWCIGSTTEHQDLAIELLKEMVSDETLTAVAAGGQQVPPTEALATSTDIMGTCPDNIMGIWKAVTIADPIAAPSYFGDLEQTFLRELEEVFSGAKEPQAAMDEAQAQIESAIQ